MKQRLIACLAAVLLFIAGCAAPGPNAMPKPFVNGYVKDGIAVSVGASNLYSQEELLPLADMVLEEIASWEEAQYMTDVIVCYDEAYSLYNLEAEITGQTADDENTLWFTAQFGADDKCKSDIIKAGHTHNFNFEFVRDDADAGWRMVRNTYDSIAAYHAQFGVPSPIPEK